MCALNVALFWIVYLFITTDLCIFYLSYIIGLQTNDENDDGRDMRRVHTMYVNSCGGMVMPLT